MLRQNYGLCLTIQVYLQQFSKNYTDSTLTPKKVFYLLIVLPAWSGLFICHNKSEKKYVHVHQLR